MCVRKAEKKSTNLVTIGREMCQIFDKTDQQDRWAGVQQEENEGDFALGPG
jgi:hypothetical protein